MLSFDTYKILWKKVIRVLGAFSEAVIIKLSWKIFFKDQKYIVLLSLAIVPS